MSAVGRWPISDSVLRVVDRFALDGLVLHERYRFAADGRHVELVGGWLELGGDAHLGLELEELLVLGLGVFGARQVEAGGCEKRWEGHRTDGEAAGREDAVQRKVV